MVWPWSSLVANVLAGQDLGEGVSLQNDDEVFIEIEGIGILRNLVRQM